MAVARCLGDVHLVSADSMQVYRHMDIGTAKPTPAERAEVPHHCIDLVEPTTDFTVAAYKVAHADVLADIDSAGGVALIVGGTGLYHRVVIDDFDLPGEWPAIREELAAVNDSRALHQRLESLDPVGASKIEPSNHRRVVRALEVTLGSGRPFSSFGPGVDSYPPTRVVQIGIRRPRPVLSELIERRVHRMVDDGLVDEVRAIATDPDSPEQRRRRSVTRKFSPTWRVRSVRMKRSNSSSPARGSSPSARSDGSVGIHAYAGSTSNTIRSPTRCPR